MTLTPTGKRTYHLLRAEHTPALTAYRQARHITRESIYPWLTALEPLDKVTGTVGPFTVTVEVHDDADYRRLGEDDVTGWFTDTACAHTVPNPHKGTRYGHGAEEAYYHPANDTVANARTQLAKAGNSRSTVEALYRAQVRHEMDQDHEREWYGVSVTVSAAGRELAADSVWGIDTTPAYQKYLSSYLVDTAEDLIDSAVTAARVAAVTAAAKARDDARALERIAHPAVSLVKGRITWTFYGHWDNDELHMDSYELGQVTDERTDDGGWEQGLWAASGTGATLDEAWRDAIAPYLPE